MIDDAGVKPELPAPQRSARWQAGSVGDVEIVETDTLGGDAVNIGAGVTVVAIAAQVVGS